MNKTPDEIKKGLECCMDHDGTCEDCPYSDGECRAFEKLAGDALALIQQKEAENAEQADRIRVLESRNNAMYHTILGVMHFVDKWLDVPAYDPDEDLNGTVAIGRASQAREITLQAIEQLETDKQQLEGMLTHMNQLRDAAAGRALTMEERVHQLEAERDAAVDTMPHWISVEERLPEEAESVLVRIRLCDATWYEVAHRINGRWSTSCITHWMPIPQPPKEG